VSDVEGRLLLLLLLLVVMMFSFGNVWLRGIEIAILKETKGSS